MLNAMDRAASEAAQGPWAKRRYAGPGALLGDTAGPARLDLNVNVDAEGGREGGDDVAQEPPAKIMREADAPAAPSAEGSVWRDGTVRRGKVPIPRHHRHARHHRLRVPEQGEGGSHSIHLSMGVGIGQGRADLQERTLVLEDVVCERGRLASPALSSPAAPPVIPAGQMRTSALPRQHSRTLSLSPTSAASEETDVDNTSMPASSDATNLTPPGSPARESASASLVAHAASRPETPTAEEPRASPASLRHKREPAAHPTCARRRRSSGENEGGSRRRQVRVRSQPQRVHVDSTGISAEMLVGRIVCKAYPGYQPSRGVIMSVRPVEQDFRVKFEDGYVDYFGEPEVRELLDSEDQQRYDPPRQWLKVLRDATAQCRFVEERLRHSVDESNILMEGRGKRAAAAAAAAAATAIFAK